MLRAGSGSHRVVDLKSLSLLLILAVVVLIVVVVVVLLCPDSSHVCVPGQYNRLVGGQPPYSPYPFKVPIAVLQSRQAILTALC